MKKIFFLFIIISMHANGQNSERYSFTAGTRGSYLQNMGKYANGLNYFLHQYSKEVYGDRYTYKTNLNFRIFDPIGSSEHAFWDPSNVSAEILFNKVSFQVGFMQYRFSETFGLQILDVANPRDYSEFVFNDLSWAKRSVFGLNMQNKWDRFEALWMLTLWPNGDRLPYKGTPYDLTQGQYQYYGGVVQRPWFEQYEYGARFKYLFENGLSLSFLGYHHAVRPTVQTLMMSSPGTYNFSNSSHQVNSFGLAASYVFDEYVVRGDFLLTTKDNYQSNTFSYSPRNHYQHLIGVDRLYENWTVGIQLQNDFLYKRSFVGVKVEYTLLENWTPALMSFVSDQNNDSWIQVKNSFNYHQWRLDLVADFISGQQNSKGLFGNYSNKDRILIDLSRQF